MGKFKKKETGIDDLAPLKPPTTPNINMIIAGTKRIFYGNI